MLATYATSTKLDVVDIFCGNHAHNNNQAEEKQKRGEEEKMQKGIYSRVIGRQIEAGKYDMWAHFV
jgi:hypothetical protein